MTLIAALGILTIAGCAEDTPSVDLAKAALRAEIDEGEAARLRLEDVEKTDGQSGEVMGTRLYMMDYKATIEVLQTSVVTTGEGLSESGIRSRSQTTADTSTSFSWDQFASRGLRGGHPVRKGDRLQVIGQVEFIRKESGWHSRSIRWTVQIDSSKRTGTLTSANQPPPSASTPESLTPGERRCADSFARHPLPKVGLLARLLGRRSDAQMIPSDTTIALWIGYDGTINPALPLGTITVLPTGEVCVGDTLLSEIPNMKAWNVSLSIGSPITGDRLLMVFDADFGLAWSGAGAWIVNPDSTSPLSSDLRSVQEYSNFSPPVLASWSRNGGHLLLRATGFSKTVGFLSVNLRNKSIQTISFDEAFNLPDGVDSLCPYEGGAFYLETDPPAWQSDDVATVDVRVRTNCPESIRLPSDSLGVVLVDLAKGTSDRLK